MFAFGNLSSYKPLPTGSAVIGPASLTFLTPYSAYKPDRANERKRVQSSRWLFEKYDPYVGANNYRFDPNRFWISVTALERAPLGNWVPLRGVPASFTLQERAQWNKLARDGVLRFNMKHLMPEPTVVFRLGDREAFASWVERPNLELQTAPQWGGGRRLL